MTPAEQTLLPLTQRSTNSILQDQIDVITAALHDECDAFKRVNLTAERERLTRLIGGRN